MPILAPDTRDLELGQSQIQPADTYAHPQAEDETILKRAHRARQNGEELSHAFAQLGHTIQSVSSEIGQMGERMGQKSQAEADQEARQNMDLLVEQVHQDIAAGGPKDAQADPKLAQYSPSVRAVVYNNVGNDDGYKWALQKYQQFYQDNNASTNGGMMEQSVVDKFNSGMIAEAMQHVKDNPFYGAGYIKQVRTFADKINAMSTEKRIQFFQSNEGAAYLQTIREEQNNVEHPKADVPLPPTRPAELGGKQADAGNIQLAADNSSMSDASNDVRRTNGVGGNNRNKDPFTGKTYNGPDTTSQGRGLGLINTYYRGDLNHSSNPNAPSPNQMFTYLKSIGASNNEAIMLTSAAASESGLNPRVTHDGGIGFGLFGHNGARLSAMRSQGLDKDWMGQAKFALQEARQRGDSKRADAAKSAEELVAAQLYFERPTGFKEGDVTGSHNYTGRLNTIRRFSSLTGGAELPLVYSGSGPYIQPGHSSIGVPDKITSPISGVSYNLEKAPSIGASVSSAADQALASSIGNTVHPNGGNPLSPIGGDSASTSLAKTAANNSVASDANNSSDQNAKALASAAANAEQLNSAGIAPTRGSVYAAGALGVDNATKVYKANNGAKASEVIDAATLAKHPEIKRMSVGEVKQWAANRVGERINPLEAKHNATRKVDRMFSDISSLGNAWRRELLTKEIVNQVTKTGDTSYLDNMPPEWITPQIEAEFAQATRHAIALKDAETSRQRQLQKEQQEVLENGLKQGINEALISGQPISPDMARNPDGSINNKVLDYMREAVNKTLIPETQSVTEMNTQLNNVTMSVATGDWKSLGFDHEPTDNEIVDKFYHNPNLRPQELKELNAKVDAAKKIGVATNIPEVREAGRHIVDWAKEIDKEKAKMAVIEPGSIPVIFADKAQEMYDQRVRQLTGDYIREHHGMPNTWTSITDDARKYVREEIGNSVKAEAEAMKAKAEQLRGGGSTTSKPAAEPAKPTETKIPSSINFNDLTPQEQGRVTSTGYLIRDGAMIKVTR